MAATPAAWTTKQATRTRNGRLPPATRSWARRVGSLAVTVPAGASRVRVNTRTVPTIIMVAMKMPIARLPVRPLPKSWMTSGATAPETRMVRASTPTRQVIIRVRSPLGSCSPADSVMSAGIAT